MGEERSTLSLKPEPERSDMPEVVMSHPQHRTLLDNTANITETQAHGLLLKVSSTA